MEKHVSRRRTVTMGAGFVLGVAGFAASTLLMSGPAAAEPPVPSDVWIQCSGFSGPNTSWPHPLTGCISRQGEDPASLQGPHQGQKQSSGMRRS
jgi:hypothetical protein